MSGVPPPPPSQQAKKRPSRRILAAILAIILISVALGVSYAIFLQPKRLHGAGESWSILKSSPRRAYISNGNATVFNVEFFSIDKDTPKIDIKVKFLAEGLYPYIENEAAIQSELRLQIELRQTSDYQIIATRYCYPTAYWHEAFEGVVQDVPISTGGFLITYYTPNAQLTRNWYYQIEIWGHY